MTLEEFRKNIKVPVNNDLIKQIVLDFVNSNQDFYNPQKGLMTLYKLDENNKGKIISADLENFKTQLQIDMLRNRYGGKENFFNVPEDVRILDGEQIRKMINNLMYKYEVSFDKDGIFDNSSLRYEHVIIIKTKPSDYMQFLSALYKELRDEHIYNAFLLVETPRVVKYGYEAPIKINCASSSLPKVLEMLNKLEYKLTSKALPVLPLYNRTGTWYGYDQYSSLPNDTATEIFTSIVFEGVFMAVQDYIYSNDNMMIDGMSAQEFYERNSSSVDNRQIIKAVKRIVKQSIEENRALMSNIIITVKNLLKKRNVDLYDVLSIPTIVENMNIQFGILDNTKKDNGQPIVFPLEEVKISYDNYDPSLDGIVRDVENMREVLDEETRDSINNEVKAAVEKASSEGILISESVDPKSEEIEESREEDVLRVAVDSSHNEINSLEEDLKDKNSDYNQRESALDEQIKKLLAEKEKIVQARKSEEQRIINEEIDLSQKELQDRSVDEDLKRDLQNAGVSEISSDYFARFADEIKMTVEQNAEKKEGQASTYEMSEGFVDDTDFLSALSEGFVDGEESIFVSDEETLNNGQSDLAQDSMSTNEEKKEIPEEYKKYEDFLDFYNFALLGDKIKNSDKTLYEYLEEENVLSLYAPDTAFILAEDTKTTWRKFVNYHVVSMLMQAGYFPINDLIEMSLSTETPNEVVTNEAGLPNSKKSFRIPFRRTR